MSGTSFTDTGLAASTTYSYQVAAFDKASPVNVSAPSGALSVTTQSTVASSWSNADIGAVNAAGSFTFDGSTFTVKGSGVDVYSSADSFQFVYQTSDWRRLDHGPRGQPDQHQCLGQGRRHVP